MSKTINLYFYDKCKEVSIGDTVTIFRATRSEHLGERATFTKLTERYAEFTTPSGAVVKVYNSGKHVGGNMYLGHYPAGGFRKNLIYLRDSGCPFHGGRRRMTASVITVPSVLPQVSAAPVAA